MNFTSKARKNSRKLGQRGERDAAALLENCGMKLLSRNYRCKAGELDLVVLDGMEIVFVEVKSMRYRKGIFPAANLSMRQRRRNRNAAAVYLKMTGSPPIPSRFDLVEVCYRGIFLHSIRRTEDYLPPFPPEYGK